MQRSRTFGQKLGADFGLVLLLTVTIGVIAIYALTAVVQQKDRVIDVNVQSRLDAERLNTAVEQKVASARGFLLAPSDAQAENIRSARSDFNAALSRMRERATGLDSAQLISEVERAEADHQASMEPLLALRRGDVPLDEVVLRFERDLIPTRQALSRKVDALVETEQRLLTATKQEASDRASAATTLVVSLASVALVLGVFIAVFLTRGLSRQIGAAVQHVQSASTELQTAANQQASGANEQSAAMSEITTTISELLATARQIAQSAQRVTHIAAETATAARAGEKTVGRSGASLDAIKRQVDLIVTHMLDLGKKSQQIGGILEIINELAEQTNILAINATIEAAGAGDAGKRFAVVADEIRKLADRVGGSTREIRGLIEEVRAAVNMTVMTTEGGTKAVDAGTREFAEVAAALTQIVASVTTTTDAAREIELSTRQQTTAVEQVNIAIADVAQATLETEASAGQTLQTAGQLTKLSTELMRLIQPQAGV